MKILYIHGFGSRYDEANPKVKELSKLGEVVGIDVDYTMKSSDLMIKAIDETIALKVDLIVGTSMGGWLASWLSDLLGIPFVAMNPSPVPSKTLLSYIGKGETFFGTEYTLTEEVVTKYPDMNPLGYGLVFLESGDKVIDPKVTFEMFKDVYSIEIFEGGSHRFENTANIIDGISAFYSKSVSLGF